MLQVVPAGAEAASGKEQARPAGDQPSFTSKRPAVDSLGLEAAGQELSSCRVELAASRAEEKRLADQHLMYLQVRHLAHCAHGTWWVAPCKAASLLLHPDQYSTCQMCRLIDGSL